MITYLYYLSALLLIVLAFVTLKKRKSGADWKALKIHLIAISIVFVTLWICLIIKGFVAT